MNDINYLRETPTTNEENDESNHLAPYTITPPENLLKVSELNNPESFLVYYTGNIYNTMSSIPRSTVILITPYIAAIFVEPEYVENLSDISGISILEPNIPYILTDTSPLDSANITEFTHGFPIDLNGSGVIITIIDTGIDYLNKEFINEDDTSRVVAIWDQTDNSGTPPPNISYGSEYSQEQINAAIRANAEGNNPYDIVPEKDTQGHGTKSAGIIAARGYGSVRGAAPNCELLVVKLKPQDFIQTNTADPSSSIALYSNVDISIAIKYAVDYRDKVNKPMVVFLPVSSNYGGHDGGRPMEEIIDYYSFISNIIFAVGTGNQGNSQTHVSGVIPSTSDTAVIELQVSENQPDFSISIWANPPDKLSIGITSPSGQVIPRIPVKLFQQETLKFIYENTTAQVNYFFPNLLNGNESVNIKFFNIASGIWKITIFGDYIVNGIFNSWITQRPITRPGTLLLNSDNSTTITIPSTSNSAIATSFYNQNDNTLVQSSGVGYTTDNRIKPDLSAGGINVLTTNTNNRTTTISGSSAATAVLAGAIALILQWSVVDGNLPNISNEVVRALLIRGTSKEIMSTYPNPFLGYGLLNLLGTFDAIRGIYRSSDILNLARNYDKCSDNVETLIPYELFKRLIPHSPDI